MKLSTVYDFVLHMFQIIRLGLPPTARALIKKPSIILQPRFLSQLFLANVWSVMGEGLDQNRGELKRSIITAYASGVVLEIGAGNGHSVNYLDRKVVSQYIALEPNPLMQENIRKRANASGFHESDGSLIILSCGAEEIDSILTCLRTADTTGAAAQVDTILSVLTLCTVPSPQKTIDGLAKFILRPGGQFIFYEHTRSKLSDVAWWQKVWSPFWSVIFDGCKLDRPTDLWVNEVKDEEGNSLWREGKAWSEEGELEEDNMLNHRLGRFVKK
ncbi:hypothetical protein CPC08DRAFT_714857 [Agrocybe pediades]|nr:hypothetical protein CPC08DRAFT_714857 [Agrocybe pediades]